MSRLHRGARPNANVDVTVSVTAAPITLCIRAMGGRTGNIVVRLISKADKEDGAGGIRTPKRVFMSRRTQSGNPIESQGVTSPPEPVLRSGLPENEQGDHDLAGVVAAWPKLPKAIKTAVVAILDAVKP